MHEAFYGNRMQYLIATFLFCSAAYAVYRAAFRPGKTALGSREQQTFSGFELLRAVFLLAACAPLLVREDAFGPEQLDRTMDILLAIVAVMTVVIGTYIALFAREFAAIDKAAGSGAPAKLSIFKPTARNNRITGAFIMLCGIFMLLDAAL